MPAVSVIVPTYNAARFLAPTLESLLRQSLPDWECIVVDDGSTDESAAIANQFVSRDRRFRYLRQENSGRAIACNTGYAATGSDSRYLFFLDSDDLLAPRALETLCAYLDAHSEVGVVGCQFEVIDAAGQSVRAGDRSRWVPSWRIARRLRDSEFATPFVTFYCATGQGPFALIRRAVFEKTTGFERALSPFSAHEDTDIFCQLALHAPIHYIPERVYLKRDHGGNITHSFELISKSYGVFRAKWEAIGASTAEQAQILQDARRFYRRRFLPLRDFKVGCKALGEAASTRSLDKLRWSMSLFSNGISGICKR
jgi:glycosyltransferase involved in cell wall biosynthesis